MGVIRKQYRSGTFIVVDDETSCDIFYKTQLQTMKLTWQDTAYPQKTLLRSIAERIILGDIRTIGQLYGSFEGKITVMQVNNWYSDIIG